jgi:hypothetical protein
MNGKQIPAVPAPLIGEAMFLTCLRVKEMAASLRVWPEVLHRRNGCAQQCLLHRSREKAGC